jgi:hypothetical protein
MRSYSKASTAKKKKAMQKIALMGGLGGGL